MIEAGKARTTLLYWTLQILCWSIFFHTQYTGEIVMAGAPPRKAAALWGCYSLASIALTQILRRAARRRGWFRHPPGALLLRIVAGTLAILIASWLLLGGLSQLVYGTPLAPLNHAFYGKLSTGRQLINQCIFVGFVTIIWVVLYFGIVSHRDGIAARLRQAQLAEALQSAELRLLKSQLNPHFLFNALNSVRALIAADPEMAQDSVTRLARSLRYTLASGEEDCVTLARELEMVDDYLGLEALRLADRLTIERDIDASALSAQVPIMMLQTLVENAIKHGISALKQGGALRLAVRRTDRELELEITNACPAPAPLPDANEGIGLKNLSERLRLLFGPAASLRLDLSAPGLARAQVKLPV